MIHTPGQMTTEQRPAMRGGPGTVSIQHFFKPEDFKATCRLCARLTLPPGAGIGVHTHETEDEVYIITRGRGLLDDGGTRREVGVGDAILTGNGASHAITNNGNEDLEMIAVVQCY